MKQASMICTITGISVSIENLPSLPFSLEYENPIHHYRNAIALASLSAKELSPLTKEIKAGIFLALLHSCSLTEDKLSAQQRNALLVQCFSEEEIGSIHIAELLHSMRRIVESNPNKDILNKRLPHFAFSLDINFASVHSYVETCHNIIWKPTTENVLQETRIEDRKVAKQETHLRTIKTLVADLLQAGILSEKTAQIFANVQLWDFTEEKQQKYITWLKAKGADTLAFYFSLLPTTEEEQEQPEKKERKTLAELMAERKERKK
jgi:hypothetical protein